jgi:hypothetical protein
MSDVKRVLLERLLNHRFADGTPPRIDPSDQRPETIIWGDLKSADHQEWIFGDAPSLKYLSLDDKRSLTDPLDPTGSNPHNGVDPELITEDVVLRVQALITAMIDLEHLFPEGDRDGNAHRGYDLYTLTRDKLFWNFEHGKSRCAERQSGDNKFSDLTQHGGY